MACCPTPSARPAGEVDTTPVAGSSEGKVVQTRSYFRGKPVDNLTLTVSGGKVTAMIGSGDGWTDYQAAYDASADPRKDAFGFIDLGINANVKLPAGSTIGNRVPAGAVTVGAATTAGLAATTPCRRAVPCSCPAARSRSTARPSLRLGR